MEPINACKLDFIRLSRNPHVPVVDFEGGLLGKASETPDGTAYVILEIICTITGVSEKTTRIYLAHDDNWPGTTPSELLESLGKPIKGRVVTLTVKPYLFEDVNGELTSRSTFTTFILPNEEETLVFARLGYTVLDNNGTIVIQAEREPIYE